MCDIVFNKGSEGVFGMNVCLRIQVSMHVPTAVQIASTVIHHS